MNNNKKRHEEFVNELRIKKPNIEAVDKYINKDTNMLCRCKVCGNEWISTPRKLLNLTNGTGCKNCSKHIRKPYTKRSKEQLQRELEEKGSRIRILGKYTGMTKKIEVECLVCGEIWNSRPDHLTEGHGCPKCGGAKHKTNNEFLFQLEKINAHVEILESYINSKTKIKCRCKGCGFEWKALPTKLIAGNGCPNCDSRNKTSFSEQAILYYVKQSYPDAIGRYKILPKMEFDIYVPKERVAIEYDGLYWHKKKKYLESEKYKLCMKEGIKLIRVREGGIESEDADYVIDRGAPYNYKTLDNALISLLEYLGCNNTVVNSEKDGCNIREQYYTELKNNSLGEKYPLLINEWFQEKNGRITPFMVIAGCNDKYWWKCSECGYEWKAAVCDRSLAGKGCKKCADKRNSKLQLKSDIQFSEEMNEKCPNIQIVGTYMGTHRQIEVMCKQCENVWSTYPTTLLRGGKCPKCYSYPITNKKKTHEVFLLEMEQIQPNLIFIDKYQGRKSKLRAKCKICNEELFVRPADLLHGYYKRHLH